MFAPLAGTLTRGSTPYPPCPYPIHNRQCREPSRSRAVAPLLPPGQVARIIIFKFTGIVASSTSPGRSTTSGVSHLAPSARSNTMRTGEEIRPTRDLMRTEPCGLGWRHRPRRVPNRKNLLAAACPEVYTCCCASLFRSTSTAPSKTSKVSVMSPCSQLRFRAPLERAVLLIVSPPCPDVTSRRRPPSSTCDGYFLSRISRFPWSSSFRPTWPSRVGASRWVWTRSR